MTNSSNEKGTTPNKITKGNESESSDRQNNQHPGMNTSGLTILILGFVLYLAGSIKLPICSIGTCSKGLGIWLIVFISSIPIMLLGIQIADDEI